MTLHDDLMPDDVTDDEAYMLTERHAGHHLDCDPCEVCHRHTVAADQWPCLHCSRMLCASCECPDIHHGEACS